MLRLLRAIPLKELASGLQRLQAAAFSRDVSLEATEHLSALFGDVGAPGAVMVVRATEGLEDPRAIAESCVALSQELIRAIR